MNQNNVSLGRVTRKRMHEYYKNFVSDPDIFMDMSKYFEYQYSPERIDSVKAKLFCPEIAGLFCRIAGLFCHDSRANLSLKPVCFGIAIS